MADITSANSVLILTAVGVWNGPQQIQGYATDDVYSADPLDIAETMMGVDGGLSAGFVYNALPVAYNLMAGSPSIALFDALYTQSRQTRSIYWLNGSITLPSLGMKYALVNGVLKTYPAIPDGGKVLKPRKFSIVWESISPARSN
jgi:hypothetical protein